MTRTQANKSHLSSDENHLKRYMHVGTAQTNTCIVLDKVTDAGSTTGLDSSPRSQERHADTLESLVMYSHPHTKLCLPRIGMVVIERGLTELQV